ncbi:succinate dehydrogenase, cytochrome b556 subunit [Pseudomethylobacillus aquaticus]|nr:succinate dehydrogenase, cytochrome b556 subunit [Pseudomethylobacillus aquaticus]
MSTGIAMPYDQRPKNLNLASIRLPVPALVSILHRASGALIFLLLPVLLWALQQSTEAGGYAGLVNMMDSAWIKLPLLVLIWAFIHHFLAGIRHLTLDMRFGLEIRQARRSSKLVLVAGLLLTLLTGIWLW